MNIEIDKIEEWYKKYILENQNANPDDAGNQECLVDSLTETFEKMRYKMDYDELTDIYNIEKFYREVSDMLKKNPDKNYVIIRLDFDRFEIINALFGTDEGDRVLQYIGRMLKGIKNRDDFCYARVISDVFAMCFAYHSEDEILALIHELEQKIKEYPVACRLMPYFGIYKITDRDIPVSIMVDYSKLACRSVKGNIINNYAYYEEKLRKEIIREVEIERDMEKALQEGQFKLFLQPKYDIATGEVIGAEALCRWLHPQKGMVSPDQFISLFERNGFIIKLDRYMWEEACRVIRRWMDQGCEVMPVSLNVSRTHAYNSSFEDDVMSLLEKYQIPPSYLELELTESAYLAETETMFRLMGRLKEKGLRFTVDDFGTGYSSLNMLKNVPVDIVKLDREFLSETTNDEKGHIIIKNMITLVNDLNMKVIAEGVETVEQEHLLLDMGCRAAQGYYYSRPLPVREFEQKAFHRTLEIE